jgi:RNA recognition motif-containing protein
MKRLFVGSLPYETTEDQVHEMFKAVGKVNSVQLITDRDSGLSKGFAFVEMPNDAEAAAAIQKLNGTPLGTRNIVVNEARPKENRGGGGYGGRGGGRDRY